MKTGTVSTLAIALAIAPAGGVVASPPPYPPSTSPSPGMIALQQPTSCQADPVQGTDVVALSTGGQAGAIVPYAVDEKQVSRLVPVTGTSGKGVTLVLSSSASVVWDLRSVAKDRIKAVYLSGNGAQGVIGAPSGITVEFSDASGSPYYGGPSGCRPIPAAMDISQTIPLGMAMLAKFGRYPDRLYAGRAAASFDLDGNKAKIPDSVDVKLSDIRTKQPLAADTPPPAPLLMKKMFEDGTMRPMSSELMMQLRNSGIQIEPINAPAQPVMPDVNLPPNMPEEMRQRILESRRMQQQQRIDAMTRASQYVPSNGIVLMKSVDKLPFQAGTSQAVFLPSDVQAPTQIGLKLYRIAIKASELPSGTSRSDDMMTRGMDTLPGQEPDILATWKGDYMTIKMPRAEGMAPRSTSSSDAPASSKEEGFLVPALVALLAIALGAAAFLFFRRRKESPNGSPVHAAAPSAAAKGSRVEALEVMVKDPELKDAVRDFKQAAMKLIAREDLEADLSGKANDILQKQFSAQASRYLAARPSADEPTGAELDKRMLASLRSMTAQLEEIGAAQNKRHIDALG